MKISKRLSAVTEMVTEGAYVFDVGCDHGYTSITLVEQGICPGAVASDVREGPLRAASANVARAHLSDRICLVLTDGIPKNPESYLPTNAPASLIVTGMGGQLILRILRGAGSELERFSELILGPQSEIPLVRKALPGLDFEIVDERIIEEDGKYYFLIKAAHQHKQPVILSMPQAESLGILSKPQADALVILSEAKELLKEPSEELCFAFGRPLLLRRDPTLGRFLTWRYGILKKIEENILAGGQEKTERFLEVLEEKKHIEEAILFIRDT